MADFIPDNQFTPDSEAPSQPQAQSNDFIPDDKFQADEDKYNTPGQTLAAGAEAAARGLAGPLAPIAEKLAGVPYKEQREREAAHSTLAGFGEVGGLGLGMFTGSGEARLMSGVGHAAEAAAGLGNATRAAKIGSSAVRNAAEMAILQGSDNVSKNIMADPQSAAESALANVGLAAAIGAGGGIFTAGVLSPLWQAVDGPKMTAGLKALVSRLGGTEATAAVKSTLNHAEVPADEFHSTIQDVLNNKNPMFKANIHPYSPDEYSGMKTYLSPDKQSGYAVKPDGELVSVFSKERGRGEQLVDDAVLNKGANKLDAYDINGKLPNLYGKYMDETGRVPFSEEYAPKDWDYEKLGKPDFVTMGLNPQKVSSNAQTMASSTADNLERQTGVPMPPAAKAVVNEVPGAMEMHSGLMQDDTKMASRSHQKTMNEYEDNLAAQTIKNLGRDPATVSNISDLDKYSTGRAQGETLHSELTKMSKPTTDGYDAFENANKNELLNTTRRQTITEQLGNKVIDQGWHRAQNPGAYDMAVGVIKDMQDPQSITDIKKYITNLRNANPYGSDNYMVAKQIGHILQDNLGEAIGDSIISKGGPDAAAKMASYATLRQDYAKLITHFENLDEYLKVGKWHGPESFLDALKNMSTEHGERIADRLSGKNNANVLDVLKQTPETLNKVKQLHIDKLLSDAIQKAPAGKLINERFITDTLTNPNKMSPQIRNLIMTPEQQAQTQSINKVMDALRDPTHNFSNTARTLAKQSAGAISPISMIAMLMGHGEAGILSWLGTLGFNEARPALRLSMLKFLGSDAPVSAPGMKAMASMIDKSYKGGEALSKATKAIFQPGLKAVYPSQMPTPNELAKLDKLVAKNQDNPNNVTNSAEQQHIGHYAQDHQQALIQSQTNAQQYLANLKPKPYKPSPLDSAIPPSKIEEARYQQALMLAQNPLIITQKVKEGTLQLTDLQDVKAMYPAYFNHIVQNTCNEMAANKEHVSYKTRMSLGLMCGQPLDSSMLPTSIQAAQPIPKPPMPPVPNKTKKGTSTLGKSNTNYQTPSQAAEADRSKRE